MIERYIEILTQLRDQRIELKEFLYAEGRDEEGLPYDMNARKRFQLLKAMQYSRSVTDELLLAELLKAEIERHEKEPFQGHYPALNLSAYLLSLYQKPEYTELFLNAKQANFDTQCGFDYEYLISAGIPETYAYIGKVKPVFSEDFYEYFGKSVNDCKISEQELRHWKEAIERDYPGKLEIKDITDEIQLAIDLDEKEILEEKIDQWERSINSWSQSNLQQLSYYKGLIANVEGQIRANEELFNFMTSDKDKASGLLRLSELYLKVNDHENAWSKLKQIQHHLQKVPDWKMYGLGRFIVEAYFDLILSINSVDDDIVREAYRWVSNKVYNMKNLSLNLIEKAAKTGDLMRDSRLSEKFYKALESKKKELDRLKLK